MSRRIFAIAIVFHSIMMVGQIPTYFSDTFNIAPGNEWSPGIIVRDSFFYSYIIGVYDYVGFEGCRIISKYNRYTKERDKIYFRRHNPHLNTMAWKDSSLYFFEFSYESPLPHIAYIKHVDEDLVLQDSALYAGDSYYNYLHSRNMFFDQDTLYLLFREPIDSLGNAVMRVSKMLYPDSMIWEQRHIVGRTVYPYSFQMSMDTAILVSAFYWEGVYAMGMVAKLDRLTGDTLWTKRLNPYDTWQGWTTLPRLTELNNGDLAVCWTGQINDSLQWNTSFRKPPIIMRMDKNGNLLWKHHFLSPIGIIKDIQKLSTANNGDIIGIGDWSLPAPGWSQNIQHAWMFRMNPEGEVLWERIYKDGRFYPEQSWLSDLVCLDNGNFIATGAVFDSNQKNGNERLYAWLIGVDSLGCTSPDCLKKDTVQWFHPPPTAIKQTVHQIEVDIYPNPFTNSLHIRSEDKMIRRISLHDVMGRLVFYKKLKMEQIEEVHLGNLPSGIYMLTLADENGGIIFGEKVVRGGG